MNCNKYKPLILDYLEKSISDENLKLLLEHLDQCSLCKNDLIEIESLAMILKDDNKMLIKEKYFYFQDLTASKLISQYKKKKLARFIPQKAFGLAVVFSILTFVLINSYFTQSENLTTPSISKSETQNLEIDEYYPSLFNGETVYNVSVDKLINSAYFKNEFEILNNFNEKFLPTLQKYFELDSELIEMNSKEVDSILEQLKNKSFI